MLALLSSVMLSAGLYGPAPIAAAPQESKISLVEEPASDHEYPAYVRSPLSKRAAAGPKPETKILDLMGLGIREGTIVNGERKPDILNKHIARALLDVYLGEDPISKSGKKNLVKRLPELVAK